MYLIPIAWLYVAVMMALAEATNPQGSYLGALFTLVLYGLLPLGILMYILGGPARRRAKEKTPSAAQANEGPETATGPESPRVPTVGEK